MSNESEKNILELAKQKTVVSTAKMMSLKNASDNPIYNDDLSNVIEKFTKKYPTYVGLDGLTMRTVLSNDATLVNLPSRKYELWLTCELPLLDKLNALIKIQNAQVRRVNKIRKQNTINAITTNGRIDCEKMISFLNNSK